jgi:hypothetical protein
VGVAAEELKKAQQSPASMNGQPANEPPDLDEADAAELMVSGEDAAISYLPFLGQRGYFFRGWSNLLAAYPRVGKTELLAACCPGFVQEGETVLFFTEEPRAIWRKRLTQVPGPWAGVRFVFAMGASPLAILVRIQKATETVIVIDTLRGLGLMPEDECSNSGVARALSPFVTACRAGAKTLIGSHHMRKGGGEHGEGIAGGHALMGLFDVALELRRDTCPNRRVVKAYARLEQPADLLYERDASGRLVALGAPAEITLGEVRRRVLDVLDDSWRRTSEVLERLEEPRPSDETVRKALAGAARETLVERDPPITWPTTKGKTIRWRVPARFPE